MKKILTGEGNRDQSAARFRQLRAILQKRQSEERCDKHPRYNLIADSKGDLRCPMCVRIKNEEDLKKSLQLQEQRDRLMRTRGVLLNESVFASSDTIYATFDRFEKGEGTAEQEVYDAAHVFIKKARGCYEYNQETERIKQRYKELQNSVRFQRPDETNEVYDARVKEWESYLHTHKERMSTPPKKRNGWLMGLPGTGKTHLAMAILKELNKIDGVSCLFVSVEEIFRRIKEGFSNNENLESYYIQKMSSVDFLVIDDIGKETGSSHTDKEATDFTNRVYNAVIDARVDKTTIYTMNLNEAGLESMYDRAIVSRMTSDRDIISFHGIADKRSANEDVLRGGGPSQSDETQTKTADLDDFLL